MSLYSHRDSNIRKTWLLITVFLVLIIGLGWIFSQVLEARAILYGAIIFSIVMNFVAYWHSDKIALAMSGARPAKKEENVELFRIVENLSITAGLPRPRLYLIPGMQINAFATGRNAKHAAVALTEGALMKLDKNELAGVMAHELSHIGNNDILVSTVVVVLAGLLAMMADWFLRISFFGGFRGGGNNDNRGGGILILILSLVVAILAPLAAMLIQFAVSRKREYLADASGALLTRYPDGLADALEKIGNDRAPLKTAHNATAHLFISSPFKGKESRNWLARLFMTHPPIEERVKILRNLKII